MGKLFGLWAPRKAFLQDAIFPQSITRAHKGPSSGIGDEGKILGLFGWPLIGTIVKLKVSLNPTQTAAVAESSGARRP